jgi:hypothetical protein
VTLPSRNGRLVAARYRARASRCTQTEGSESPAAGFLAGWMFLCAKSASAVTAALGFAG